MSNINTTENDSLFPRPKHNPESLTQDEVRDILHFADAYGISGAAEYNLLLFLRNRTKQSARHDTDFEHGCTDF